MTIFYFTGTGNSLFVARKIANATGAKLISIPQAISEQKEYSDDCIGFVYPQYAAGIPKMVRSFILNNSFKADYIFAIDLYAFIRANALGEIAGIIPINYGRYLKTPNNFTFIFNPPEDPSLILTKTEKKLIQIVEDINSRKLRKVRFKKGVGNATKYFGESKFKISNACTKCKTCENVCPAHNVDINRKVVFGNNCETCYSCADLCPSKAIYSNKKMQKHRQYRNPYISTEDIINANQAVLN